MLVPKLKRILWFFLIKEEVERDKADPPMRSVFLLGVGPFYLGSLLSLDDTSCSWDGSGTLPTEGCVCVCVCEYERGYRLLACATLFRAPFCCGKERGLLHLGTEAGQRASFGVLFKEVKERKG